MGNLLSDLRYGFRTLRKNPGFAAVAVLALALGIGANTAIFSAVYATLLEPLPYPHSEQLVMVWSTIQGGKNSTAAGDYLDWVRYNSTFQYLGAWTGGNVNLSTSGRPERIEVSHSTPGFQASMGHKFLYGRDFLPEEGEPGKDHVAILTNRIWRNRFDSDKNIVGKQYSMNGEMYTVVGVMAPGPADKLNNEMYVPLAFTPDQKNHDFHWLLSLGRLKPGVTIAQANADMQNVANRIAQENPKSNTGWGVKVEPLQNDFLDRDVVRALWLLLGAAGFVLLIACANIANLLLARATTRQREVAVRASLGASRGRLFGQFLAESLALSLVGCVVGIALAWVLVRIIMATMPPFTLPSEADVHISLPVLAFTIAASLLSGVLFGCVPAWQASRMNLNEVLKEGGRGGAAAGRHGLRRVLVVLEFALALSLLTGGGLAIHSLWNVAHVNLGFKSDHLLTFFLPVPDGHLKDPAQIVSFYQELHDRVVALPGVTSMSISEGMPMQGTNFGMPFTIEGHDVSDPSKRPGAGFNMVMPGFFDTFGIQIVKGRPITEQDRAGGMQVAVVNEAFAKKYFDGVDPLTQRILVEQLIPGVTKLGPATPWQIVGVYRNVKNGGPKGDGFPEIDVPFTQSPWPQAAVAVRTVGDPGAASKSIADIVQSFDSNLPLAEVKTMDQIVDEAKGTDRFVALLFGGFAALALLLAALGIYGVMSFAVAQRTHEIGLRMALGADSSNVLKLILREGMLLAMLGAALGLVGAYFVGRGMQSLFFGVGKIDFTAFSIVAVLLMISAVLACYVPAHRATRVDPMQALRDE
jgi:putative ABC transport system permease protein